MFESVKKVNPMTSKPLEVWAFICHKPAKDEDSIYQQNFLHVQLGGGGDACEVKTQVFYLDLEGNKVEVPFLYIESYDSEIGDGYYFLPDRQNFPDTYFEGGLLIAEVNEVSASVDSEDASVINVAIEINAPYWVPKPYKGNFR